MTSFKHVLMIAFVGLALVAGPTHAAFAGPQAATKAAAKIDDDTLQERIETALEKDSTLAPRNIDVDVAKGVVTLTGTVRSSAEKTRAARLARISGVTRVENELEIDPKVDQSKIDTAASKTKTGLNKEDSPH